MHSFVVVRVAELELEAGDDRVECVPTCSRRPVRGPENEHAGVASGHSPACPVARGAALLDLLAPCTDQLWDLRSSTAASW